jgi:hypothetical protein
MNTLTVESEIHFHRRRKGASKTIVRGPVPVIIGKLQSVAMLIDWRRQRTAWELLLHHAG